eukprot:scaffold55315_cov29-Tisochrysis_lutea.AAC.1
MHPSRRSAAHNSFASVLFPEADGPHTASVKVISAERTWTHSLLSGSFVGREERGREGRR